MRLVIGFYYEHLNITMSCRPVANLVIITVISILYTLCCGEIEKGFSI